MYRYFKVILINLLVLLSLSLIIELTFGYWFDEENFGPHLREHRMRKTAYEVNYDGKKYDFVYKRNYYGLRGEDTDKKIESLIIGGSTVDERYKPAKFTITEILNQKLRKKNIDLIIYNAGIEGQSTRGHIYNHKYWFPKIKNFEPKFLIYYTGINDIFAEKENEFNLKDGMILGDNIIIDNIKSRSFIYDSLRKIKHRYSTNDKKIQYDFDAAMKDEKNKNIEFLSYREFKKSKTNSIKKKYMNLVKVYLSRIDQLYELTLSMGAVPIFINQLDATGYNNERLVALNISLINHCKLKNYKCIDLSSKLEGKKDFWWDGIHTTPKGSLEISKIIAPELERIIQNNREWIFKKLL